jgi:hypothetical protein
MRTLPVSPPKLPEKSSPTTPDDALRLWYCLGLVCRKAHVPLDWPAWRRTLTVLRHRAQPRR